jgi:hypothetical protein
MDFSELRQCEVRGTDLSARIGLIATIYRNVEPRSMCFSARSIGNIRDTVLFREGGHEEMYWYNPKACTSERVEEPSTDEQAIKMLAGNRDSAEFIKEYYKLRRSGSPIEQALVLVGHEFRLRKMDYQLALR